MNNNVENITFKITDARVKLIQAINEIELPISVIEGVINGVLLDLKNQELINLRSEMITQVNKEIEEGFISKEDFEKMKADGRIIEVDDVKVEPYEDNGKTADIEGVTNEEQAD